MIRKLRLSTILLLGSMQAENPAGSILQIDVENWVQYLEDSSDWSLFATKPNVTPAQGRRNFASSLGIADIVAINGTPAKGTMIRTHSESVDSESMGTKKSFCGQASSQSMTPSFDGAARRTKR